MQKPSDPLESGSERGHSPATESTFVAQPEIETPRCCALNQTRGRVLSVGVEAADFSPLVLSLRLIALTPSSDDGLLLRPFRGIPRLDTKNPIDLIYLDQDNVVIDTVESFSGSDSTSSSAPAASVLALPANSIDSTETLRGDQLVFCAPREMHRFLGHADLEAKTQAARNVQAGQDGTPGANASSPSTTENAPPKEKKKSEKGWLSRFFSPDPPPPPPEPSDRRSSPREKPDGLGAYFFTGGTPKAHEVRDINAAGLFIFTDERWYLGNIIRITLTDRRHSSGERSITVNAKAVRWGNEGVGLQFVYDDVDGLYSGALSGGANKLRMEQFLKRVASNAD